MHYLISATLAVLLVVEYSILESESRGWLVALSVVGGIALLFTRDFPFVAPLVAASAIAGSLFLAPAQDVQDTSAPFLIVILFLPWCLGTYNERNRAIVGLIAIECVGFVANIRFGAPVFDYFWIGGFIALSWATGFILSRRSEHAREMAERARRLQREQVEAADRAVAEERQRIARELHDVIAHSVSVMTVQAGAVRRLLLPEQQKERQALETVEATGRQALTEMRRLVGLLREQGAMPEFSPQPGLGTIDSLLERMREAGLPVELQVEGTPQELPPGVDLAAYRVVQEALTNALKYAGPAQAWVTVCWGDDELQLEIANDGSGGGGESGSGHGLEGMRERVVLYGGEIESGRRDGGGYVVRARLPVVQT